MRHSLLRRILLSRGLVSHVNCGPSSRHAATLAAGNSGELQSITLPDVEQLLFKKNLPSNISKQVDTLGELSLLIRRPYLEVQECMEAVRSSLPSPRIVLWGAFGTGKSVTLNQAVHNAHQKNWVIIQHRSAMELTRRVSEVEMSSYKQGRINDPVNAVAILQLFKQQNQQSWKNVSELKTEREYEWNKTEKTKENRPITEIVEMGLSAPTLASDCVGALFRELRRHSSNNSIKILVAVDDANSLWGKTLVKKSDRTYAGAGDLTLVRHFRKMIASDWSNGLILLVADKKELSDARDELTVPRNTPLELFGEEGFDFIEPFLPIETEAYSDNEMEKLYKYYYDKNWISSKSGRSEQGKLHMKHLSAANPHNFERLVAFN